MSEMEGPRSAAVEARTAATNAGLGAQASIGKHAQDTGTSGGGTRLPAADAARDLAALRDSALPTLIAAVRHKSSDAHADHAAIEHAKHRVQLMIIGAAQRVSEANTLPGDSSLRYQLDMIVAAAVALGAFVGYESLLEHVKATSSPSRAATTPEHTQLAPAAQPIGVARGIGVVPEDLELGHVELGAIGAPIDIVFYNMGGETVAVDHVRVSSLPAQAPPFPGEFDITGSSPPTLAPKGIAKLDVAFRPVAPREVLGSLVLTGHTPSGRVHRSARIRGIGMNATRDNIENNELSIARRNSLEIAALPRHPSSYAEMLTVVLAAQRLTNRHDPANESTAATLLQPVSDRLDELIVIAARRLPEFGAGNVPGWSEVEHAKSAVQSWMRRIRLGSSIATQPLVDEFRYGAETIRILTGERSDAPSLRAFHRASMYTAAGAAALIALPAVVPTIAEEAAVIGFALRQAGASAYLWAAANPGAALAVLHTLIGVGMQLGEDPHEWPRVVDRLKDPVECVQLLAQIFLDIGGIVEGLGVTRSTLLPIEESEGIPQAISKVRVIRTRVLDVAAEATHTDRPPPARPVRTTPDTAVDPEPRQSAREPTRPVATPAAVLNGDAIAASMPGTAYTGNGAFRVMTSHGSADVVVERVGNAPRLRANGGMFVVDIPKGLDAESVARAITAKLAEVRVELETAPTNVPARTNSNQVGPEKGRVSAPVQGVYDSIDPKAAPPKGWTFQDRRRDTNTMETTVIAPNGAKGTVLRSYDPRARQWIMREAFFASDMPRWIENEAPMVAGRGTPVIAYLDMRQMRALGVDYGTLESTKLSTVQNVEAICQLETNLRKGMSLNEAVRLTHSVAYAETELIQSGHQIAAVRLAGADQIEFNELLEFYETRGVRTAAQHDAILAQYGMSRKDVVHFNYDVYIDLVPFSSQGAP